MPHAGRVLIVDDHPLTREGLAIAVRAASPGVTIVTAGSIVEAEDAIARYGRFTLVMLDLIMPGVRGFSGVLKLQRVLGPIPLVMISARQDPVVVEAARALGVVGYLTKTEPLDVLTQHIRDVLAGRPAFSRPARPATSVASARERIATLSGAQLKVLLALADGRLNKQIAGDLNVSEATIKAHLTAIFRKLGVINRAQALLAMQPLLGDAEEQSSAA